MTNLVIFASGNGSNFQAIIDATSKGDLHAQIKGLICDHKDAYCITRAQNHQIPCVLFNRKDYESKSDMDEAILNQCRLWDADWLILAGYMRLLSSVLIQSYPQRIINIHPSLLPQYKGKDALGQALAAHETTLGVSIHYVDEGMDTGSLIAQYPFQIKGDEDRSLIEEKLHQLEHKIYPLVIQQLIKEKP
ncbi:MAG: phosphoribosylglycinamide formyltransferase [Erysipelotrichaceae bacterium]|nr:phosphoribosylglycinamide formyltransferase [Erysipelotrichaceae bacterium]